MSEPDNFRNEQRREKYLERALSKLATDDRRMIELFIEKKRARKKKLSRVTADNMAFKLALLRGFLDKPFTELTIDDIDAGVARIREAKSQKDGRPLKKNSVNTYIMMLKNFLYWMIADGHTTIPENYVKSIEAPGIDMETETSDDILTVDEVMQLIKAAKGARNKAIICTVYEAGLRISEAARLKWKDVKFDDHGVELVVNGKMGERREVWLKVSRSYLATWKNEYPIQRNGHVDPNDYVFISMYGTPISYLTYMRILNEIVKRTGITKRVHMHLLRKSRITHLYALGYNDSVIKEIIWKNQGTQMSRIYVKLSKNDTQRELKRRAGVPVEDAPQFQDIQTVRCLRCETENEPTIDICKNCGYPLTKKGLEASLSLQAVNKLLEEMPEYKILQDHLAQKVQELKKKA
jgi:integrase/recombinase XerD